MTFVAGFAVGVLAAATIAELALAVGAVDRYVYAQHKRRRMATEVRRKPARWPPR